MVSKESKEKQDTPYGNMLEEDPMSEKKVTPINPKNLEVGDLKTITKKFLTLVLTLKI